MALVPTLGVAVSAPLVVLLVLVGVVVAIPLGVMAVIYLIVPFFKGLAWLLRQVGVFIFSTVADALRLVGALITSIVLIPLTLGNVIIGRWSASAHFGRAITAEFKNAGRCAYRLFVGNPARLLCLTPLTEGLERRIPEVMAAAPGADRPSRRLGQFQGYEIVGSLRGGGSGGRLYVAKPDAQKLASFARNGHTDVDRVVIKSFALDDGTTLPQIVRENRALDAAKRLGLILEHELTDRRFYYVMRYVPGESLNLVTQRLHASAGGAGLGRREVGEVLSYTADLLRTLGSYHEGGLWHKDVKPDNIIVCDGRAHLVDFGLVTPLRSSMTLTTHGTEYFRDPEMVRMALKGVKVHEVDGAKFDLYAVGAVLFSMIENSFPAHGGLSQITRPCPEAVRWIVRRAMTDYDKRYVSARAMLADIETVLNAPDPFALRPAHLPSVAAASEEREVVPPPIPPVAPVAAAPYPSPGGDGWSQYPGMHPNVAAAAAAAAHAAAAHRSGRVRPEIRVTDWITGRYSHAGEGRGVKAEAKSPYPGAGAAAFAGFGAGQARRSARVSTRASAAEQLHNARTRAAAARERARKRMNARIESFPAGINAGVVIAVLSFFFLFSILFFGAFRTRGARDARVMAPTPVPAPLMPVRVELGGKPGAAVVGKAPAVDTSSYVDDITTAPRAMILCDWSRFDEARQYMILSQVQALGKVGFRLLGDYVPGKDESRNEEEIQAVSELRAAIGTQLFQTPGARDAIRSWLDHSGEADVVVWFASTEPGKPSNIATAWVVGSSETPPELLKGAGSLLQSVKPREGATAGRSR